MNDDPTPRKSDIHNSQKGNGTGTFNGQGKTYDLRRSIDPLQSNEDAMMPNVEEPAELTELADIVPKSHLTDLKNQMSEQDLLNTTRATKYDERGSVNPSIFNHTLDERLSLLPSRFSLAQIPEQGSLPESYMTDPTLYKVIYPKSEVERLMSSMKIPNRDFAEYCVKLMHDKTLPSHLAPLRDHLKDQAETNIMLKEASSKLKVGYSLAVANKI